MVRINDNYLKLSAGYLFPEIERRVRDFESLHPDSRVIRLGIGDVTQPLPPAIISALHAGVEDLARAETFKGYGPDRGYRFLRELIVAHDFRPLGVDVSPDEVFVSDGSKCDSANIQELFATECRVAVTDPVYPVYIDTNVMAGRSGPQDALGRYEGILYMPCREERGFLPATPAEDVDVVYLCSPNNPTGTVMTREALREWVEFARSNEVLILFDAAYEAYIGDASLPRSIYEIEGARECAIEFRSFSKKAGFTGVRCAFTVVPRELSGRGPSGELVPLHGLWSRRHATKFNGTSYPVQRGAAAVYSEAGRKQVAELIAYYLENARIIREGLTAAGYTVYGGEHAPYIWLKTPAGATSWEFFDHLLARAGVVGTPGSGFGPSGEGFFRLSAFGSREAVEEAVGRIRG